MEKYMLSRDELYRFMRMIERQYSCRISIVDAGKNVCFSTHFPEIDTVHLNETCLKYKHDMDGGKECVKCDCRDSLDFSQTVKTPFWKICPAGVMELVCTIAVPGQNKFQIFAGAFKVPAVLPEPHLYLKRKNIPDHLLPVKELSETELGELPILFQLLAENISRFIEHDLTEKKQLPPDARTYITNYIDSYFRNGISLAGLAEHLGWSPSHTTVRIRQFFGKTFLQLLTERRINNAKWLLRSHYPMNIATIAKVSGFPTAANFYKCFQRYTGMTPHEFRKKSLAGLKP